MGVGLDASSVQGPSSLPAPGPSLARRVRSAEMFDATLTGAAAALGLARPSRPMPGPMSMLEFDIARFMATGAALAGAAASALTGAAGFGAAGFAIGLGGG